MHSTTVRSIERPCPNENLRQKSRELERARPGGTDSALDDPARDSYEEASRTGFGGESGRRSAPATQESAMAEVVLEEVTKVYPGDVKAVDDVSLVINDREFQIQPGIFLYLFNYYVVALLISKPHHLCSPAP